MIINKFLRIFNKTTFPSIFKIQSLFSNQNKLFSEEGRKMRDYIKNMDVSKPEEDDNYPDDDSINIGDQDKDKQQRSRTTKKIVKKRILEHPKDILNHIRENYYEQPQYINITLHLTADFIKRDQRVKGVFLPFKKLDINNVLCVITNEKNKEIVEKNGAIFADETILQQIKTEEFNYNKIICTEDSLDKIDSKMKELFTKNEIFPNSDQSTLCSEENLDKILNNFNNGLTDFAMNKYNFIDCNIGMTNFSNKEILFNLDKFLNIVNEKKPKSLRAMRYFKRGHLHVAKGKYYEIFLPNIIPSSSDYYMNENIQDEELFVTIENVPRAEDGIKTGDTDDFKVKI